MSNSFNNQQSLSSIDVNAQMGSTRKSNLNRSHKKHKKQSMEKKRKRKNNKEGSFVSKRGRWEIHERIAFLKGFQQYGKGKWKAIAQLIPNRTTIQVKTHAQMVLKKIDAGENVFDILNSGKDQEIDYDNEEMHMDDSNLVGGDDDYDDDDIHYRSDEEDDSSFSTIMAVLPHESNNIDVEYFPIRNRGHRLYQEETNNIHNSPRGVNWSPPPPPLHHNNHLFHRYHLHHQEQRRQNSHPPYIPDLNEWNQPLALPLPLPSSCWRRNNNDEGRTLNNFIFPADAYMSSSCDPSSRPTAPVNVSYDEHDDSRSPNQSNHDEVNLNENRKLTLSHHKKNDDDVQSAAHILVGLGSSPLLPSLSTEDEIVNCSTNSFSIGASATTFDSTRGTRSTSIVSNSSSLDDDSNRFPCLSRKRKARSAFISPSPTRVSFHYTTIF